MCNRRLYELLCSSQFDNRVHIIHYIVVIIANIGLVLTMGSHYYSLLDKLAVL